MRSIIFCIALWLWGTNAALAAIIPVFNTNDNLAGSLRQAIQDASPGDTIVFQIPTTSPGFNANTGIYTIGLTSGSLVITKNLTIDGGGQKILVTRAGSSQSIFSLTAVTVSLLGLTITNGNNTAVGISNGTLNVTGCSFSANTSPTFGGAIIADTSATLRVSNCTFAGNSTAASGSAISSSGTLFLDNSTISGNNGQALGGNPGAAVHIHAGGTARVRNTIIVGNTSPAASKDVNGTFISEGYNLIGTPIGSSGFGATGDQIGASAVQVNLSGLNDNGGPTRTMRPGFGSVAIDQGKHGLDSNNQPINTDQRGYPRPVDLAGIPNATMGDGSDIGAVETGPVQAGTTFTVTNTAEHSDGCTTDDCTFLEAITAANANGDTNAILFAANVSGLIGNQLNISGIPITAPVNILGPGARLLAIVCPSGGRILNSSSANVMISGLSFRNGALADGNGGAIYNGGGLTLRDCTVASSLVEDVSGGGVHGGGLYSALGTSTTLIGCTFFSNSATQFGGGVYTEGNLTATNCTFTGNSALRGGGLILRGTATITLRNCTFSANTATDGVAMSGFGGGGLYCEGGAGQHFIGNTLIAGNSATNDPDIRGNYTSDGHNFIGKIGDATGLTNGANGNQIGTVAMPLNAQFGSFGNNGGLTDTWSLLGSSTAINGGDNALAPAKDQRAYSRSGTSDIGAFEFNGTAPPLVPLTSVVSSKVHGAQTFGVNLPLSGSPGVECRSGGAHGDFTIVFNFVNTLTLVGGVSVTSGAATIVPFAGINVSDAHQYIVQLTGVVNAQVITLQLVNVNDSLGNVTPTLQVPMGVLLGDTTGSGTVNATDVSQAKLQSGQAVTGSNFRNDITVSGSINATDVSSVKLKSGTALP